MREISSSSIRSRKNRQLATVYANMQIGLHNIIWDTEKQSASV